MTAPDHHCQARLLMPGGHTVECKRCRLSMRRDEFEGCKADPGIPTASIFAGAVAVVLAIVVFTVLAAWLAGAIG